MKLVIVLGPPSSGKSTYCKRHSAKPGTLWIDGDLWTEHEFNTWSLDRKIWYTNNLAKQILQMSQGLDQIFVDMHLFLMPYVIPVLTLEGVYKEISFRVLQGFPKMTLAKQRYTLNGWNWSEPFHITYNNYVRDNVVNGGHMVCGYSNASSYSKGRVHFYNIEL